MITIEQIIKNFDNISYEKKMSKVLGKLYKIDKKIYEFEDAMFKNWDEIKERFEFEDKTDYFDYMTSTPKFEKMMETKHALENYLYDVNNRYYEKSLNLNY